MQILNFDFDTTQHVTFVFHHIIVQRYHSLTLFASTIQCMKDFKFINRIGYNYKH